MPHDRRDQAVAEPRPVSPRASSLVCILAVSNNRGWWAACAVAALLLACILARSFELDECYSFLILSGHPRLSWPAGVFERGDVLSWFSGTAPMRLIPGELRAYDVHPPLWFFAASLWRHLFGPSLIAARAMSSVLVLAAFPLMWSIARRCSAPPLLACLLTFLSYDLVYTGSTARMYPMGLLLLLGTYAILRLLHDDPRRQLVWAAMAGLCFGCAGVTHFLTLFVSFGLCLLAAIRLAARGRFLPILVLGGMIVPFLVWGSTYYLVQDRRDWEFRHFELVSMLTALAKDLAVAVFGGLPLHFSGPFEIVVGALVSLVLLAAVVIATRGMFPAIREQEGQLILAGLLANPIALLALGVVFNRQSVEPRYMLYCVPFLALFISKGLRDQPSRTQPIAVFVTCIFLTLQILDAGSLPFARVTQQQPRPVMAEISRQWQPGAILLLPEADDTSGMTAAFLFEAHDRWSLYLVNAEGANPLKQALRGRDHAFAVLLADNAGHRALARLAAVSAELNWRDAGSGSAASSKFGRIWTEFVRAR